MRTQTDVHDAGLAHALGVVEAVLYAVGDVHIARTEAHEHEFGFGRNTVVGCRAVAAGCYACHVRAVEC